MRARRRLFPVRRAVRHPAPRQGIPPLGVRLTAWTPSPDELLRGYLPSLSAQLRNPEPQQLGVLFICAPASPKGQRLVQATVSYLYRAPTGDGPILLHFSRVFEKLIGENSQFRAAVRTETLRADPKTS